MTRRAYLYFTLTIILGAVLGGAGVYYFLWHTGRLQHPGFNKVHAEARLKKRLNLSAPQLQQIDKIFDASARKLSDLQKQVDPQFEAIRRETRAQIRQVLDADQGKKFDEFVREIDERRKRRGIPPPPPPR